MFLNNVDDIEAASTRPARRPGIPDIAVVTTEVAQQCSPTSRSRSTRRQLVCDTKDQHPQTYQANVGRAFYYQKKYGKDLHGGLPALGSDLEVGRERELVSR